MNLKIILILSISHFTIDLTGAALPAMMPFVKNLLQLSYTGVGAVIMAFNITSSIIQPCFGYVSDKIEIKWLLPISTLLTYIGFSFIGITPSFIILLILVIVLGLGVASYHPESMKVIHYFTGSKKATGMSFFQVGGNLGLAVGPLLITYAIKFAGLSGSLLFLLPGLSVLGLLIYFSKELSIPVKRENDREERGKVELNSLSLRNRWRSMSFLILAVAIRSWAHIGLMTFVPFYYINVLKGDAFTGGRLVFVFLMGGVAGTMIGAMIADRIGHKNYFSISMLLSTPLLFIFLYMKGIWVPLLLFLSGFILISSFTVTIVMGQFILKDRLGMASGLMMGFVIGVGGLGAGALGLIADVWGLPVVMKLISIMPAVGFLPILMIHYPEDDLKSK